MKSLRKSKMKRAITVRFSAGLGAGFFLSVALLALPARGQDPPVGPLVEVSRPNAVGSCNDGFNFSGLAKWSTNEAEEPFVAANPIHPNNLVAVWIQGPFQDVIAAVSFDGGQSWQQVPIPLTICSGGPYLGAGDPKLSFGPTGDLYLSAAAGNSASTLDVVVSKSTDGGLHWSALTVLGSASDPFPTITADPTNAQLVYAMWDGTSSGKRGPGIFTRSTDGGLSWQPARAIIQTDTQSAVTSNQIFVLSNGTLVDVYELDMKQPNSAPTQTSLKLLRSNDQGQTWSAPINAIDATPVYAPNPNTLSNLPVTDPITGQQLLEFFNPWVAMDSRNGNLYATWQDGRFSNFQTNDVAFSMSTDGGLTWSVPIRVNQTPTNIPLATREAVLPFIAVTAGGTIGVTYYDFRFFNSNSAGLPTDRWLVSCSPSSSTAASNPACWGNEVRLTDNSFNMEAVVPNLFGFLWLGDYFGLAAGNAFITTFTAVDSQNITSIFARRVGP